MTSTIKVNNVQNQCGANIINENSNTITIGASGDTIALASGASQTGFGRTGTVDWDTTPKTATFTGVSGDGFFCNTTAGAFTCNLPSGSAGSIISLADYAGTWQTNNLTVSPNGSQNIGGVNADVVLNTQGQSVTFVYVDGTQGWLNVQDSTSNERANAFISASGGTETEDGNFKVHTFTGPGTFTVSSVANCAADNVISYLMVGGGGNGGATTGGGGGAGGFREVKSPTAGCYTASPLDGYPSSPNRVTVTAQAYPIVVGAGGAAAPASNPGVASTGFGISAAGGGAGGDYGGGTGGSGGSGGGGAGSAGGPRGGGAGNTPPTTPSQGFNGGNGASGDPCNGSGGGGGGATAVGANAPPGSYTPGGAGGAGATSSITGSPVARAGGGGGSAYTPSPPVPVTQAPGGAGGGGAGKYYFGPGTGGNGSSGTANTGGGAGGGVANAGGSGIVIIRYKFQ